MKSLRLSLFALLLLAVLGMSQEAEANLVEIRLNDTDLLITEEDTTLESETDIELFIRLKGEFRDSESDLYVESISINVFFRNNEDPREYTIGYPEYQSLCSNCSDPGYDEYRSLFRWTDERFTNYLGEIEVDVTMKNGSGSVVWDDSVSFEIVGKPESSSSSDDTDDELLITAGIVGVIIFGATVVISRKKTQDPYAQQFPEPAAKPEPVEKKTFTPKKKNVKAFKPKAELVDIECPGCDAQMKVAKLNEMQEVTCKECGLSGEIEI